jgi:hypothetical protein
MKNDNSKSLGFAITFGIFLKLIFVMGGYIIKINPIANGILVVPLENELMNLPLDGIK